MLLQHDSCLNSFDEKVQSLNKDVTVQKWRKPWLCCGCSPYFISLDHGVSQDFGPVRSITEILSFWIPVLIQAITQLLFAMVQRSDEIVHPTGQISLQYFPVTNFHWLTWFQTKTMLTVASFFGNFCQEDLF